ncbi:MAG: DUF402 domain-containing protein [Candidatus Bathyarchaeota archaeon]|nr:DUF402 domain-containing protein [Candidatus Bathyarchaeota archaeon]
MKAKIRGVYSTALTKLLIDNGFEIVQSSLAIKNRFGLSENPAPPDLVVKDRYDLQGVRALGSSDSVSAFQSILQSSFSDVLTRKWMFSVNGIYKGMVVESDEHAFYVDIGEGVIGRLPRFETIAMDEKQLIVHVERRRVGSKQPILTTNLKIVGNYAILAKSSKIGVSLKIRDLSRRAELYALGKSIAPEDWGIIWRESSATQQEATLENEIARLVEKVKLLDENVSQIEAPTLLVEGSSFMDVEFPWFSKKVMDKLRSSVAPTFDGHHFYKSCGGKISSTLEMAEKLLEKRQNTSEVEKSFKEQILGELPEAGSQVNIEHVKLSGVIFHLGEATIENLDDEQVRYNRVMRRDGFYDGLNVKKEAGDKAVSETKIGEWSITTRYFSSNGECKGTYINLNTPLEVYPNALRYVDLEVDVCILPDGTVKTLDEKKLEKAEEKSFISKTLYESITEQVKKILKELKENKQQ